MATHSTFLAWRIPWMGEPGGLQSMGLQRIGHDQKQLSTGVKKKKKLYTHTHTHTHIYIYIYSQSIEWVWIGVKVGEEENRNAKCG